MNNNLISSDREKIVKIFEYYLEYVRKSFNDKIISPFNYESIIIVVSYIISSLDIKEKEKYIDILYQLSKGVFQKIDFIEKIKEISMISGLGYSTFAIRTLNKNLGILGDFSESMIMNLSNVCYKISVENFGKDHYSSDFYDCINGICGCVNFLIENEIKNDEFVKNINKILEYIIYIVISRNNGSHKFYMEKEDFILKEYKEIFCDGAADLSVSHGIASILYVLCKAKNKGYYIKYIDDAINDILLIYDKFIVSDKKNRPLLIDINFHIDNIEYEQKDTVRESWCYGKGSLYTVLMNSAELLDDNIRYSMYKKLYIENMSKSYNKFNLNEMIICHGHSSLISIILANNNLLTNSIYRNLTIATEKCINHEAEKVIKNEGFDFDLLEGDSGILLSLLLLIDRKEDFLSLLFLK